MQTANRVLQCSHKLQLSTCVASSCSNLLHSEVLPDDHVEGEHPVEEGRFGDIAAGTGLHGDLRLLLQAPGLPGEGHQQHLAEAVRAREATTKGMPSEGHRQTARYYFHVRT